MSFWSPWTICDDIEEVSDQEEKKKFLRDIHCSIRMFQDVAGVELHDSYETLDK